MPKLVVVCVEKGGKKGLYYKIQKKEEERVGWRGGGRGVPAHL